MFVSYQNLREKDKVFEAFVSQQERLPEVCRKLEALLIAPIQRVPRYRLLLAQLVSHTEQNAVEFPVLREALEQVELVAKHINEQIREHENMQRMISIQKCLAHGRPRIIVPGRSFIKGKEFFLIHRNSFCCRLNHAYFSCGPQRAP